MVAANFSNRPFGLEEACWTNYQEIGNNRSSMHGKLWIQRYNSNYGSFSNNSGDNGFSFVLNGSQVAGWNFTYNFNNYNSLLLAEVDTWVPHSADGTKYFSIAASCSTVVLGSASLSSGFQLTTIPRASNLSFTSPDLHSLVPGQISNVNTNRASASFTHDIDYYFGNASGRAMTGIGQTGSWTPPLSLLNQITGSPTGVGMMRTHTYNGGTMIGYTEANFRLTAAADIVPTWTSATIVEASPGVEAIVGQGKFVQGISKIQGNINGAAGVYGSTITAYRQSVGTETLNTAVAGFALPLSTAGTAIPVTQEITDSRGRKKTAVTNINVMPYSKPVVTQASFVRTDGAGVPDPSGTAMKVSVVAAVQSLINTTERNRLTLRIYSKLRSESTWTLQASPVVDSSTLGYSGAVVVAGPFSVASAYDVKVELVDKFSTTNSQKVLSTGEIFQHWSTGMGLGKYWEKGMLDVAGDAYASGGMLSLGKRINNWNDAIHSGKYHANNATNSPPAFNASDATNILVGDVETWYEVQGASVFHYVKQTVKWVSGVSQNPTGIRTLGGSFYSGYALTRYAFMSGGALSWTSWRVADPKVRFATTVTAGVTFSPSTGNYNLGSTPIKTIDLNGVFVPDFSVYRVDYSYRTGDNNGNFFALRSANALPANVTYNYQVMYVSGTGTPAGVFQSNQVQAGLAANSGELHTGHIHIYNPMSNTAQVAKTFEGVDTGVGTGISHYGGYLSGTAADTTMFDGIRLSVSNLAGNNFTNGYIKVTAIS